MFRLITVVIIDLDDRVILFRIADNDDVVAATAANAILAAAKTWTGATAATAAAAAANCSLVLVCLVVGRRLIEFVQKWLLIRCGHVHVAGQTATLALSRRHRRMILFMSRIMVMQSLTLAGQQKFTVEQMLVVDSFD